MISSILVVPDTGRPFPGLSRFCDDLRERGFCAVDVIVSERDIRCALSICNLNLRLDEIHKCSGQLRCLAEVLATEIAEAASTSCGATLLVPAFATNFPNISNTSDGNDPLTGECLWQVAINNLAIALIAANLIGTRVIEAVCGRRVIIDFRGRECCVSDPDDSDTLALIQARFVEGVWLAFQRVHAELGGLPDVAVGIELEPDILALANDLRSTAELRKALAQGPQDLAIPSELVPELREHFGINLDWGHLLVTLDRQPQNTLTDARMAVEHLLDKITPFIVHVHAGDHAPGAHWIDAPLASYRPLPEFGFLCTHYARLLSALQERTGGTLPGVAIGTGSLPLVSRFATGCIAIELEARGDLGLAVQSRDQLLRLAKYCHCSLAGEDDRRIEVEHNIASLPAGVAQGGWFEGVNGEIFSSLDRLFRRSRKPEGTQKVLLDEGMMKLIRQFLICRNSEARTRSAIDIVDGTLARGGVGVLSTWIKYLLNQEWLGVFYPAYRDHTVHAVYVYLLGWCLYTECPQLRHIVQGNEELLLPVVESTFARQWTIAALGHDIGYPLESDRPNVRIATVEKLNSYYRDFISWAILSEGNPRSDEYVFFKSENDAIQRKLVGDEFRNDTFHVPLKADPAKKDEGEERLLTVVDIAERSGLFESIPVQSEENLGLGGGGLKRIFEFLRRNEPQGSLVPPGGRPAFLDHGIMSASILCAVRKAHDKWAGIIREKGDSIEVSVDTGVSPDVKKRVCDWPSFYGAAEWAQDAASFENILTAIAAHNIYPEPAGSLGGNLHRARDVSELCPILRFFRISEKSPLTLLLAMCDTLQEWHRYHFGNPLALDSETLEAFDLRMFVDPRACRVRFSYPGNDARKDRKVKEFNARFGDAWKAFIEFA